jgi:branched-chain amino acid transport system permease protein
MSILRRYWKPVLLLLVLAGLVILPNYLKNFGIYLISMWAVMSVAALGLNLTLGYAGQISLAQGAFVGIGAYTVAILLQLGVPYPLTLLLATVLCFVVGWLLGYPALRVQHHYLAFVTLAFSTLVFLVMRNEEWLTNGIYGMSNIPRPVLFGWSTGKAINFYYFALGMMLVIAFALWWMVRSPWGRAFVALRENPVRALSLGVDTRRYTLMAFAIGSAIGGLAGGIYAPLVQFFEPNSFSLGLSLNLLLMVVVGGSGFFFGPFVGAIIAVLLPEWMRVVEGWYLLAYAVAVMLLMAFCPSGIIGLFQRAVEAARRRREGEARAKAEPTLREGTP